MTGRQLRRLRLDHGLTQDRLGVMVGTTQSNFHRRETGALHIYPEFVTLVREAFAQIEAWRTVLTAVIKAGCSEAKVNGRLIREMENKLAQMPLLHKALLHPDVTAR